MQHDSSPPHNGVDNWSEAPPYLIVTLLPDVLIGIQNTAFCQKHRMQAGRTHNTLQYLPHLEAPCATRSAGTLYIQLPPHKGHVPDISREKQPTVEGGSDK